jgi:hypothetical protein
MKAAGSAGSGMDLSDAKGVENGCDSGGSELAIVIQRRRLDGPYGARPWLHMPFDIVRVKLDKPRHEDRAFAIDCGWIGRNAIFYIGDLAIANYDGPRKTAIRQHNFGICEDFFVHAHKSACLAALCNTAVTAGLIGPSKVRRD